MRPVHTVRKVPGCFRNRNRRFLHNIRVSEFMDISIRDANKQSPCFGLGLCQSLAHEPQSRTDPKYSLNSEVSKPEWVRAGRRQTPEKQIPAPRLAAPQAPRSS